jgi:hypothetical protein
MHLREYVIRRYNLIQKYLMLDLRRRHARSQDPSQLGQELDSFKV